MHGTSNSYKAQVSIRPASVGKQRPDPLNWIEPEAIRGDVLTIDVSNSLARGYGTFQMEIVMRDLGGGITWEDVIQPYSLVSIALHHYSNPLAHGATVNPEPVMLGLVDKVARSTDYRLARPRRTIIVTGRSLTAVLLDHRWWFHAYLNREGNEPADLRESFTKPPSIELLRDEIQLRALGFLSVKPTLFDSVATAHPIEALKAAFEFFVGTPDKPGFIKLQFPDGRPLPYRLQFAAETAKASFFDPGARLSYSTIPTEMPEANCWDICRYFCEEPFTELFSDTYGETVDNARVVITARKPPWLGHIEYSGPGGRPSVGFSFGSGPANRGSLFDWRFGDWDINHDTFVVEDIAGEPLIARGLDSGSGVFTAYFVHPTATRNGGNSFAHVAGWPAVIPPTFDEDPNSPSYIQRYGIRPKDVTTKYIPARMPDGKLMPDGDIIGRSKAYQALLRTWLHQVPHLWSGHIQMKGRTDCRVGKRMLHVRGDRAREYYVTEVQHSFDTNGPFWTTATVTRGRDVPNPF